MNPLTFDRVWRGSGVAFVVTFVVSYIIYGGRPEIGASGDTLLGFYDGDRTRILIASALLGLAVLNLLWFAAALASTLRDAGQGIWGAAAMWRRNSPTVHESGVAGRAARPTNRRRSRQG